MADTQTALHVALAAATRTALLNGSLRIYNAAYALELATCTLGTITDNGDGTLTFTPASDTVNAAVTNQTAALARFYNQAGAMLLGAFTVGTVAAGTADIQFDTVAGWDTGDTVTPGAVTLDCRTMTIVVA